MKKFIILASLLVTPALAQEILDPDASICGSVVSMLNTNVIFLTEQLAQANAKIAGLQKQIDAGQAEGGTGASGYAACTVIVPSKECLK